jgi:hypothetical protein
MLARQSRQGLGSAGSEVTADSAGSPNAVGVTDIATRVGKPEWARERAMARVFRSRLTHEGVAREHQRRMADGVGERQVAERYERQAAERQRLVRDEGRR